MLAWQPGRPAPRAAIAYVLNPDGAFKAELDLTGRRLVRWQRARGEPQMLAEEFTSATSSALPRTELEGRYQVNPATPAELGRPGQLGKEES